MPYMYLGITRDAGTSKKTGNAYDIVQVHYADFGTNSGRPDRKQSIGLEAKTMACSQDCFETFKNVQPGSSVNFEFEPDPRNMQRNIIVGCKPVQKPQAVGQN